MRCSACAFATDDAATTCARCGAPVGLAFVEDRGAPVQRSLDEQAAALSAEAREAHVPAPRWTTPITVQQLDRAIAVLSEAKRERARLLAELEAINPLRRKHGLPAASTSGLLSAAQVRQARAELDARATQRLRRRVIGGLFVLGLLAFAGMSWRRQGATAERTQAQRRFADDLRSEGHGSFIVDGVAFDWILIKHGAFLMGAESDDTEASGDERPVHPVTLTKDLAFLRTEVTQAQWHAVMDTDPAAFRGPSRPVEHVSWQDAVLFCDRLSERMGLPPGTYRLPTEAEWEYAARAGERRLRGEELTASAWFDVPAWQGTSDTAKKRPNAWGLFDMLGNVREWTADWHGDYPAGPLTDPTGPANGLLRIYRGGSWSSDARGLRATCRLAGTPGSRHGDVGFRPVLTLSE